MKRYQAQDLFNLTVDELWNLPNERHIVVFEDGEVVTHTRATILSVYLWYPIRAVPAPLMKDYHLGDAHLTDKMLINIINRIIWGIHSHTGETVDPELLAKLAFDTINIIYNDFTVRLSSHVATMSLFDVLDIMHQPDIRAVNNNVEPTEHGIEEVAYKKISNAILTAPELEQNPIALSIKTGTLNMDQSLQCFGPRGFVTDINADILPEAIVTGYAEGIDDLYGALAESRTGTKALAYNKEQLPNTEYFNRETQLIAQYVQNLHPGDCGTPYTIDFPVIKTLLKKLKGKYYIDRETNQLLCMKGTEDHLIGSSIKMRSVLGCVHPDPAGICSVCYGKLAYSVPKHTNIGQVSAVHMGDQITSTVLSTKHLDSTSKVEKFVIHKTEGKYLSYRNEPETLYLKRDLKGKKINIVVFKDEVESIADVLMLKDLSDYPVSNASQITHMRINVDNGPDGISYDILKVSLFNRKSSFSREMLEHIQKKRWTFDADDNVVISLDGFDIDKPFLTLPYKHVSMHEVMKRIKTFLYSSSDSEKKLGETDVKGKRISRKVLKSYTDPRSNMDPVEGLIAFANMLNEKLSVNIVHCEILAYAMMVRSVKNRDYRFPKPGIHGVYEKYNNIMLNRSLAGLMAHEKHERALVNPRSFIVKQRNDHPYDLLMRGGRTG